MNTLIKNLQKVSGFLGSSDKPTPISDNEIKERTTRWKPRESKYTRGVLSKYAKLVSSAAEGAICR